MDKHELHRLIDCCRNGSDDLAEVEMSALAEAIERDEELRAAWETRQDWNASINAAMKDVSVPSGLSERILAELELSDTDGDVDGDQNSKSDVSKRDERSVRFWSRRSWLAWSAIAVAASLALAFWLNSLRQPITGVEIAKMARNDWVGQLDQGKWSGDTPPADRAPWSLSIRSPAVSWQRFEALGDSDAVAYLAKVQPGNAGVHLLVIKTRRGVNLPEWPLRNPDSTTQGVCVGVWKNDGLVYVLIVPGGRREYQQLLPTQSIALRTIADAAVL